MKLKVRLFLTAEKSPQAYYRNFTILAKHVGGYVWIRLHKAGEYLISFTEAPVVPRKYTGIQNFLDAEITIYMLA